MMAVVAPTSLACYMLIVALQVTLAKLLYQAGEHHPIGGLNPVTFCNVLTVTCLLSAVCIAAIFPGDLRARNWRRVTGRQWLVVLLYSTVTCTLIPGLSFAALNWIQVSDLIILGSLYMPAGFLFGALILREATGPWQWFGQGLIVAVVIVHLALSSTGEKSGLDPGQIMAILSALFGVVSTLSFKELSELPVGLASFVGQLLGAVIFFLIAIFYFGPRHFDALVEPWLWEILAVYTLAAVASIQVLKHFVYRHNPVQNIIVASGAYPLLALGVAWIILHGDVTFTELVLAGTIGIGSVVAMLSTPGAREELIAKSDERMDLSFGEQLH